MDDFNWITNTKQLKEFRIRFDAVDRTGNGIISIDDLVILLDNMGHTVERSRIVDMMNVVDLRGKTDIHFDEFLMMVAKTCQYKESQDEVFDALKEFDVGKGMINSKEIKTILTALGDKMSDEEVDELFKEVTVKNGMIRIEDMVMVLCR